jgi:hypothetical protein
MLAPFETLLLLPPAPLELSPAGEQAANTNSHGAHKETLEAQFILFLPSNAPSLSRELSNGQFSIRTAVDFKSRAMVRRFSGRPTTQAGHRYE